MVSLGQDLAAFKSTLSILHTSMFFRQDLAAWYDLSPKYMKNIFVLAGSRRTCSFLFEWHDLAKSRCCNCSFERCVEMHYSCTMSHHTHCFISIPSLISRLTYSLKPIFVILSSYSPASSVSKVSTYYQPMLIYQSAPRTPFPLISPYDFSSKRIPVCSSLRLDIVNH